ncbi:MAG: pilus assembly protein [Caulobacter sp.]|nr:pilus assembly protein [Caulobacter sp.]
MAIMVVKPKSLLTRFAAARDGAAAVEFALVATPFLALLFGVLELGLVFMVSTTLDSAVDGASRKIRTGEMQTAGATASTFKTAICDRMAWLGPSCAANLHIDVRTFPKFANIAISDVTTGGAIDDAKTTFVPGGSEAIVLVRVYYEWSLITPMLNQGLENTAGGKRLIASTVTFRNEPFAS